jgi:hypothetical protein
LPSHTQGSINRTYEEITVTIEIKEVKNRKQRKEFIYLPAKLHSNHNRWAPPIYSEEWKYFSSQKNKDFSHSDTLLLLASQNGGVVGRIMGIINHRYNSYSSEKNARFAYFECVNDQTTANALLDPVEKWAKQKGMEKLVGPLGFSDQEPEGFLIEGFEHIPTLATYYNYEYIIPLMETAGYGKEVDYVVYKVDLPDQVPEFYRKLFKRISERKKFSVIEFSKKKQLKNYIRPTLHLMNDCYKELYGFQPLSEDEMDEFARVYLPLADPRFIKLVAKDDELVGFQVGIPNMSEGFRAAKGRLFPLGIFKILRSARKTKQLDLMLGGIKEEYRGQGVNVMLGTKMMESALNAGFEYVDSHHELETNRKMRAEMERLGGKVYKRFRVFQKRL